MLTYVADGCGGFHPPPQVVSEVVDEDGTRDTFMVPYDKLVYAVGAQVGHPHALARTLP